MTSQPAGIDCTFTATETTRTCGNVFFPAGTQVRLEARPAQDSSFLGWEFETICRDAPGHLPLARHAREEMRLWIESVAKQLDSVVAIATCIASIASPPPRSCGTTYSPGSPTC